MTQKNVVSLWYARIISELVRRRRELHLQLQTVAGQLGVSPRCLSQYEHLRTTPTISRLIRWHYVLDMRLMSTPVESRARYRRPWRKDRTVSAA